MKKKSWMPLRSRNNRVPIRGASCANRGKGTRSSTSLNVFDREKHHGYGGHDRNCQRIESVQHEDTHKIGKIAFLVHLAIVSAILTQPFSLKAVRPSTLMMGSNPRKPRGRNVGRRTDCRVATSVKCASTGPIRRERIPLAGAHRTPTAQSGPRGAATLRTGGR